VQGSRGGRKPINAKAESLARLPMFRDAYALRRCIVPIDGFFEWRAIRGARAKQPYAIAMKDGSPFGLAGTWRESRTSDDTQVNHRFRSELLGMSLREIPSREALK
jgi:putative SOS response-associated peptidase YedK